MRKNNCSKIMPMLLWLATTYTCTKLAVAATTSEIIFLKEIVTGRCYDYAPTIEVALDCPMIAQNFMSVLEGQEENDITSDHFSFLYDAANFAAEDNAIFVLPPLNTNPSDSSDDIDKEKNVLSLLQNEKWSSVESTWIGSVFDRLKFCGSDLLPYDCPMMDDTAENGAMAAFWNGAYASFAKTVQGDVKAIVVEDSNINPFLTGGIPNIDPSKVTSFSIYASNCNSEEVQIIINSLGDKGVSSVTCSNNLSSILVCQGDTNSPECSCERAIEGRISSGSGGSMVNVEKEPKNEGKADEGDDFFEGLFDDDGDGENEGESTSDENTTIMRRFLNFFQMLFYLFERKTS